ncbi:MAG: AglZ/HisF2 family acetamidino modification protein [Cyclobacteriaceae bacterium]|nr:AglZ/HisF2 family acetamidino modification protein [Cyclobacteriaceae bacterium]
MALPRVIPVLLLRDHGLVKTLRFKDARYIGDPINAVKIFNEKEVDELIFLDIDASKNGKEPPYEYLAEIASECFMPLTYGGSVRSIEQIRRLTKSGIEKVSINTAALENLSFIKEASETFGASTLVGAMDVKKNLWGKYQVYSHSSRKVAVHDPVAYAQALQGAGVGEIFINNVDLDGMMTGFDLELIRRITSAVDVPVIACGGAGTLSDLEQVVRQAGATAAAAGSMFVFHGKHRAVLITYPDYRELLHIRQD